MLSDPVWMNKAATGPNPRLLWNRNSVRKLCIQQKFSNHPATRNKFPEGPAGYAEKLRENSIVPENRIHRPARWSAILIRGRFRDVSLRYYVLWPVA